MKRLKLLLGLAIATTLLFTSCDKNSICPDSKKATLTDMTGLDGCGMMITLNDDSRLDPINLGDFDINIEDGQKVWISYTVTPMNNICMSGESITIECITER